jgi:glucoamylase
MPLVWAHAEFVKLVAGLALGAPADRPAAVWHRYGGMAPQPPRRAHWSPRMPVSRIAAGRSLRVLLEAPAIVHWSADDWATAADVPTHYNSFNLQLAELPTRELAAGRLVRFTFRGMDDRWHDRDYAVEVG